MRTGALKRKRLTLRAYWEKVPVHPTQLLTQNRGQKAWTFFKESRSWNQSWENPWRNQKRGAQNVNETCRERILTDSKREAVFQKHLRA